MSESILKNNFLDEVERFVNKNLNRKEDIELLIGNYFGEKDLKEFEDFAFLGKYVNGLFRVIKSGGKLAEFPNIEQVKKDLGENIEKVISRLGEITLTFKDDTRIKFEESYLKISNQSFNNIQLLTEDLDQIKKYLNFLKRN